MMSQTTASIAQMRSCAKCSKRWGRQPPADKNSLPKGRPKGRSPGRPPENSAKSLRRRRPPALPSITRSELAQAVFKACDADGDGRLCMAEMYAFASRIGFDGGEAGWASEYALLCSEHCVGVNEGINLDLFLNLIEDESDNGCFCTDEELREILQEMGAAAASRQEL